MDLISLSIRRKLEDIWEHFQKPTPDTGPIISAGSFLEACHDFLSLLGSNDFQWKLLSQDQKNNLVDAVEASVNIFVVLIYPSSIFLFVNALAPYPESPGVVLALFHAMDNLVMMDVEVEPMFRMISLNNELFGDPMLSAFLTLSHNSNIPSRMNPLSLSRKSSNIPSPSLSPMLWPLSPFSQARTAVHSPFIASCPSPLSLAPQQSNTLDQIDSPSSHVSRTVSPAILESTFMELEEPQAATYTPKEQTPNETSLRRPRTRSVTKLQEFVTDISLTAKHQNVESPPKKLQTRGPKSHENKENSVEDN